MANTSPEEPKAPIVRIRKKRTKKKKEDVVHLPVRASRTARYSSLTTPTNPQGKGRECCRHIFATCFKIPVCRILCFRCILPRCYNGEGSDEEGGEARDEGYHSQNRRSSEITPPTGGRTSGATGGATEIEMTDMKTETVTLIPPPRNFENDYRRHVCHKASVNSKTDFSDAEHDDSKGDDVTYIEVESVSLPGDTLYIPESNLLTEISEIVNLSGSDTETKDVKESDQSVKKEPCSDGPVTSGEVSVKSESYTEAKIKEITIPKVVEHPVDSSQYVECDPGVSDESQYYVNEEVLFRPATQNSSGATDRGEVIHDHIDAYANAEAAKTEIESDSLHSNNHSQNRVHCEKTNDNKPHEYVNINSSMTDRSTVEDSDFAVAGMVKTSSAEFKKLLDKSGMRFSTKSNRSVRSVQSRQSVEEIHSHSTSGDTEKLVQKETNIDKVEVVTMTEPVENANNKSDNEVSKEVDDSTETDRTKLI